MGLAGTTSGPGARDRPVVGVSVDFLPARRWQKYTVYDRYVEALRAGGALPLVLPPEPSEIEAQLELVDGVLLPGGDDLDPALWGEAPEPGLVLSDPRRTAYETTLLEAALERSKPVLGVCLGMQLLNVALGGSLVQVIAEREVRHLDRALDVDLRHAIDVRPRSRLARALGRPEGGHVEVNSFHRQAPARLGAGLVASARAADGVIEAVEHEGHPFCLGVQWHPDVDHVHDEGSRRLWRAFVAACAGS